MRKSYVTALVILVSLFTLTACGSKRTQETVSKALGFDVSGGKEVSNYDTHSGNGDGTSCVAISFDDDTNVLEGIKRNAEWKALPPDETVQTLVYGVSDETSSIGPFLKDGNGTPLVPEIQNGYYLLIDRNTDKGTDILNRSSFNFTFGLYDTDTNTLYFCKLDT